MRNEFEKGKRNHKRRGSRRSKRHFGHGLQAYLLILLKEKASYGYELMDNLKQFGFKEEDVDISTIYRNLRSMEEDYLVASDWSDSELGPQKRMYTITHDGEIALSKWIERLTIRKDQLEALLDKYNNLV